MAKTQRRKQPRRSDHPNCYECQYRGTLRGDCHSKCCHPAVAASTNSPMAGLLGLFVRPNPLLPERTLGVGKTIIMTRFCRQGIEGGWANWPWNFDPIWLEKCTGFKKTAKG